MGQKTVMVCISPKQQQIITRLKRQLYHAKIESSVKFMIIQTRKLKLLKLSEISALQKRFKTAATGLFSID
jgi:hypothetical protein